MFYVNDYPEQRVEYWEALAVKLDSNCLDDLEQSVWEVAREHSTPPHLGNLYLGELLSSLKDALIEAYPDKVSEESVDFFINSVDSHFYVNSVAVYNDETFEKALGEDQCS